MKQMALAVLRALILFSGPVVCADDSRSGLEALKQKITDEFGNKTPTQWSETLPGIKTRVEGDEKIAALTLDACGSAHST